MRLRELFRLFDPTLDVSRLPDLRVTQVTEDSRQVHPGAVFIARTGARTDGTRFIDDAARRGAVAVVAARGHQPDPFHPPAGERNRALPVVAVDDPGSAGSILAHLLHRQPSRRMSVAGVTGTNGKTTVTYLLRHILRVSGRPCGLIGTVQTDDGAHQRPAEMTTPGAVDVANLMARMVENGCSACAMEVSSHALAQGRVAGVRFAAGVFTNLTLDHLDYHGTMEAYAAAKARLFESLDASATAVINADADPTWASRMTRRCAARVITFGLNDWADFSARDLSMTPERTSFVLRAPDGQAEVRMRLLGRHNVENALAAAATAVDVFGLSVHQVAAALRDAAGAPGRLQRVDLPGVPFTVLVDYAHTDDALRNVLSALRPLCRAGGRLRVLFGCGGDRDRSKRPKMAQAACELADDVYVTSDNPRGEDPQVIVDEVLAGVPAQARGRVLADVDRRRAIGQILNDASPGDIVLLAGKGHETYQLIGDQKLHFDDAEEARRYLNGLLRGSGATAA